MSLPPSSSPSSPLSSVTSSSHPDASTRSPRGKPPASRPSAPLSTPLNNSLTLERSLDEFLLAKDHTPATRTWYISRLSMFFTWAHAQGVTTVDSITAPLVRRYVETLRSRPGMRSGQPLDSHTLHGHVRVIRAWLHWLAAEDEVDPKVPARIKPPTREYKVLRVLDARQIERLFLAAGRSTHRLRDTALLAVLLDTGIRVGELCALERDDVHLSPEESYLMIRRGKGRRQREVPLGIKARSALARYLRSHRDQPVFVGLPGAAMTVSGVDQALYRLVEAAGPQHFTGLKLGAHLYRHTFAVRFLEAGGELYQLSRLMGHSQVTTTEGYLRAVTARQARQRAVSPLDSL